MKKLITCLPVILCAFFIFGGFNAVNAEERVIDAQNLQDGEVKGISSKDFFKYILNNGIVSENGELITVDGTIYIYQDILELSKNDTDISDNERSPKSGYYIKNDICYEYTDTRNPIDTVDIYPGQSYNFQSGNSFSATATGTATLKASEVLSIGYSQGFSRTYSNSKSISGKNEEDVKIRYGLCKVYNVHTFDIYYTSWTGKDSFITAAVYYEPISMCVEAVN